MFRPALGLIGILIFLLVPYSSHAQQAEAPAYKDGDWWRVKVDVVRPAGVSVSGPVLERFPEYIVKFESNKPKVFGVQGNESVETDLPVVIPLVLGRPGWLGDMLRFPMRVGLTWSDRVQIPTARHYKCDRRRLSTKSKPLKRSRHQRANSTPLRLVMTMSVPKGPKPLAPTEVRTHTYYYAPDVKAIASFHTSGTELSVASTLIDFSLAK